MTTPYSDTLVLIDYTNHAGERSSRTIKPEKIWFGSTQWHTEPQWLLHAWDVERNVQRDFAMADIHEWAPCIAEAGAEAEKLH